MAKMVQIDFELFWEIYCYFGGENSCGAASIFKKLDAKLEKMVSTEFYKQYKAAATAEERAELRNKYLQRVGINHSSG